jgi:hypothetical protein
MNNNWQDYWTNFDKLIESLRTNNLTSCISELKSAQLHVNGLTDGWFEFLLAFEESINKFRDQLSKEQIDYADFLITSLRKVLTKR